MSSKQTVVSIGPFLTLAVIGMMVAKLAGWISVSWWIVFSPWLILISLMLVVGILAGIGLAFFGSKTAKQNIWKKQ